MANKRKLKKTINYICGDLFSECVAISLYHGCDKKDESNAILTSILIVNSNYIRRISHVEPGMRAKEYFRDLKEKFTAQVVEISDNIANL